MAGENLSFGQAMAARANMLMNNFANRPRKMSALQVAQTMQIMQNMRMQRDAEGGKPGDPGTAGGMMKDRGGGGVDHRSPGERYLGSGYTGDKANQPENPQVGRDWQTKQAELNRAHDLEKIKADAVAKRTGVYANPSQGSVTPTTSTNGSVVRTAPGALPMSDNAPYYATSVPTLGETYPSTPLGPEGMNQGEAAAANAFMGDYARNSLPDTQETIEPAPSALASVPSGVPGSFQSVPVDYQPNPEYQAADLGGVPSPQYTPANAYGGVPTPIANANLPAGTETNNPNTTVPLDSFAKGSSYVPKKGLYELEEGEAVIPPEDNPNAVTSADEARFSPGLYAAKQVGGALAAIPDAIYNYVEKPISNFTNAAMSYSPSPETMGKTMQGIANQGGSPPVPELTDRVQPVQQVAAIPPAEIAKNTQAVNDAKAAISKPQMDYATWAKQNPTMAGKGDALLDPAKRGAFLQSMKTTNAAQAAPGGNALPGPTITDYGTTPKEQAAAQADWSNIQRNVRSGSGGMAVHDAMGEKIIRTDVLPTPQRSQPGITSEKDLRTALGQRVVQAWQNGEMNVDDATKALNGLNTYDNQKIKLGLPDIEEKLTMRYEKDKQKAEDAFVRKQEEQRLQQHHELYKDVGKQWSEANKIEDPHEKVQRQMEINRDYFASVLPPEAQKLAEVPVSEEAYIYKAKMKAKQQLDKNPEDAAWKDLWKKWNSPEGVKELKQEHKELVSQRNAYIKPRR